MEMHWRIHPPSSKWDFTSDTAKCSAVVGVSHLAVDVAADGLLGPGLVVEGRPPLLLGVPHHVSHQLQTS